MPASRFETPRKYPCASTLRSNSFSFTHFQNKGLKTLSFHTLPKKGWVPLSQHPTSNLQPPFFAKRPSGQDGRPERASRVEGSLLAANSFRFCTYVKTGI